ncbi:cobalt-precorrin 5A acetaldehyde-lyase [Thermodesulfitimonas autotrophica]|uniref:Cobalt-precorrin 5A acetaldehyde-lyase n=1 Tax=Thermodesulfitimonas autotrophica TaxID=1894989 RepID=A0A3N5BA56_9THEO|nr:cobalamin biosynthesis protein [Thermodesulfitimonas autotrophica]RPF42545.1 cobalt-precorrin 5A acetaldehyde-lyase [Thermodesulfitimonas autotrophica]
MKVREGLAIVVLSARGYALAERIAATAEKRRVAIYAPVKLGVGEPYRSVRECVAALFPRVEALVFIGAVGVAVRLVAPHLADKFTDPPVVVVDEAGRFAVTLVGGHHGANALAEEIAAALGACPVVTTASDSLGRPAVDLFAAKFNLALEPRTNLSRVARALLDGERVALLWDEAVPPVDYHWPPEVAVLRWRPGAPPPAGFAVWLLVTEQEVTPPPGPYLFLRPRRYVVGVGCRRGTGRAAIRQAIALAMAEAGLPLLGLRELATVELKKDEAGLKEAAAELGVPVRFLPLAALKRVQAALGPGAVSESKRVKEKIGVGNVCELAALTAGAERLVVRKTIFPRVTVAVGVAPWP